MSDIFGSIERGIYQALAASPGTALYKTRIYTPQAYIADPDFGDPYIVFVSVYTRNMNTHNEGRIEGWYQVGAWSRSDATAKICFGYAHDSLHQKNLAMPPFTNTWTEARDYYTLVDNVRGEQMYYRGGLFRILITGTN